MTDRITACWKSLDRKIVVSQRELVLGLAVCTLTGIVAGIVLSPKKQVCIGSNNGNHSGNGAHVSADQESAEENAEEALCEE